MVKIEVEVVSTSIIKPSSPTPSHLRFHELSFLDQLCGHVYNPSVLFYPPEEHEKLNVVEISNKLKQSLSDVLSRYYPLAGRLRNKDSVDCNDEGIPYLEARVNCTISDFVENPILHELPKFVPFELDGQVDLLLGVQLNIFECGGIAIGSCVSHKICDGLSTLMFTKFGQPWLEGVMMINLTCSCHTLFHQQFSLQGIPLFLVQELIFQ